MLRKKNFIFALTGLIVISLSVHAYGQDKHFLWRVQSKNKSCFILGSIHFMKEEHYPLGRMIENAFLNSASLAVEANVSEVEPQVMQRVMSEAFYPQEDSLEKHLSSQMINLVRKKAEELGLGFDFIKQQKPWFLVSTLPSIALLKAGYDPQHGIDMHFLTAAKGKKKIIEVESLDAQIKMLSGFSGPQQELLLLYTLKDLDIASQEADAVVEAWKAGDTKELDRIVTRAFKEDPRLEPIAAKLLYERNKTMADRIEQILSSENDCFIVIGAAHLVGDKSVLRFLRDKGLIVNQL